jgi:DNA (cytosine-5)-methyltransferase 1
MQQDIFSIMYPSYKITKPIRLIELFAGYGSQALALKYLGVEFEHYRVVEFDKYAIQSYNEIHGTNFETKDITKTSAKDLGIIETDKYDYIMTYSFPCQDLSLAGKRKGMSDTTTRSGLLWEVERILDECEELPQVLLMENVPQVIGTKNVEHFNKWCLKLEELGYKNYHQNLIATDYGIPQTRNRTFMISILGDYNYNFPKPIPLELKLKDMLEKEVDEKYYLSDKAIKGMLETKFQRGQPLLKIPEATKKGYALATDGDGVYINRPHQKRGVVQKGKIQTLKTSPDTGVVVKDNNIYNLFFTIFDLCCIIDTKEKDKYERSRELLQILWEEIGKKEIWQEIRRFISIQEKKILQSNLYENELYEDRKSQSKISTSTPNRGETSMQDMWQTNERFRILQQTLFKIQEIWRSNENKISNGLRIRKLTPREAFRLMGVKDEDYDKLTCSDSQKYKQAGNSIVVNVLMAIFKELLKDD